MQVSWCGYLHLADQLQTDRFLSSTFEIAIECLHTSSPNHINDEVYKRNPEKSVSLWGSKPYALQLAINILH